MKFLILILSGIYFFIVGFTIGKAYGYDIALEEIEKEKTEE